MLAFKGFNRDLTCTMGKESYKYEIGKTYEEQKSKCRNTGFHCTENPLDAVNWYGLDGGSRYVLITAAGDIDETDGNSDFACTKITLEKELNRMELLYYTMMYIYKHPLREIERSVDGVDIGETAQAKRVGHLAIARGENPKVRGTARSAIGIIKEQDGVITGVRMGQPGKNLKENVWYTLDEDNNMVEVENEKTDHHKYAAAEM